MGLVVRALFRFFFALLLVLMYLYKKIIHDPSGPVGTMYL